ncbi:MAG TPA: hypothetical protein VF659_24155 [Pyrinomonadaceae bacterium]
MSSKSKFGALAGALREKSGKPEEQAKKRPKSQDKETYAQTTVYLHRAEVYNPLQAALAESRLEYSQLVEDLLKSWLKRRKRPEA